MATKWMTNLTKFDNFLITARPLQDDYMMTACKCMTTAWWLRDDCQDFLMTARPLLNECLTTAPQLPEWKSTYNLMPNLSFFRLSGVPSYNGAMEISNYFMYIFKLKKSKYLTLTNHKLAMRKSVKMSRSKKISLFSNFLTKTEPTKIGHVLKNFRRPLNLIFF